MANTLRRIRVVIGANPPPRLDRALARDVPEAEALSRSRLTRLMAEGAVSRDGTPLTEAKAAVAEGDIIEIAVPEPSETGTRPEPIPLHVVYEDDHLIVIDKPAGLVVHPAPGTPTGTLVNALLAHCGAALSGIGGERRPGIVHRIDKDTSGLIVAAKSDAAHQGLAAQFEAHTVDRAYTAFCHGAPEPGDPRLAGLRGVSFEAAGTVKITTRLDRHRADRQRQAVTWDRGRHAVTRLRLAEGFGHPPAAASITCRLETGRTHQIRVHLSYAGHALIGDPVYGGRRRAPAKALGADVATALDTFPRQALHAARLGFVHPVTSKAVRFESPLPQDMADLHALLCRARERLAP
ncbi:MAG: RluA family pseudouridine synthase [Pseudomonadota bacterium]